MQSYDLGGNWKLRCVGDGMEMGGQLPGCTYLDLIAGGMPDPFWGENEKAATEAAKQDFEYRRVFTLPQGFTKAQQVILAASGVDTLCTIYINNREVAKTDNINREWRIDIKPHLRDGENEIRLYFNNPYEYIAKRQRITPLPAAVGDAKGAGHLRKTPCHFGWDWGPVLPPAGITGFIRLERYDARIVDFRIRQQHTDNAVTLQLSAETEYADANGIYTAAFSVTDPDGVTTVYPATCPPFNCVAVIDKPRLWWCNGLGEQPLYTVTLRLYDRDGNEADHAVKQIGLRTIALDTAPDALGSQFRFIINGVPIFAKGADWIPPDSFINRVTRNTLAFYIEGARHANMNMLRIWGGGRYECDDFYDLCDHNGILVWQDFIFACGAYPFYDDVFVNNVHAEVRDNVRRIRHHASLALWCGNNENELLRMLWKRNKPLDEANVHFYHHTLRDWVAEEDGITPYWPGSPSSGAPEHRVQVLKPGQIRGDTHLWQVWHGMLPIEAFRRYPTRFCSEFGMESMPSLSTVRLFTDKPALDWSDSVMQQHQKSVGGNEKMLFYLLAKYRRPAAFEDFIYLSQLVQADTVRFATDCWRRNIGRQNGALFWQYNDCWPVASWASVDYGKQYKAVQYHARHFNKMLCLSNDYFPDRAELHIVNEYPTPFKGTLKWRLLSFDGVEINKGNADVRVDAVSAARVAVLRFSDILQGRKKEEAVLYVTLENSGGILDEKNWLLVPDRLAALPKPRVTADCRDNGHGEALVTIKSDLFARYVRLEAEGVTAPWSDNYFDLPGGGEKTITVPLPAGMDVSMLSQQLTIRSLADVQPKGNRLTDRLTRWSMYFKKANFFTWLVFKFI